MKNRYNAVDGTFYDAIKIEKARGKPFDQLNQSEKASPEGEDIKEDLKTIMDKC